MAKKIDKKSILDRAKKKPVKIKATFSLDESVLLKFQEACSKEDLAMSRVIEELMKDFGSN